MLVWKLLLIFVGQGSAWVALGCVSVTVAPSVLGKHHMSMKNNDTSPHVQETVTLEPHCPSRRS